MRISQGVRKILLFGALMISGCMAGTAPQPRLIEDAVTVSASYDATWSAVIETFADLNLSISNMEKDSGLIATDWISFRGTKNDDYCDCGTLGYHDVESSRDGKFNVFVKEEGNGSVRVKVNTIYRQTRASNLTMPTTIDCVSTGSLESKIHIAVKEKL